MIFSLRKKKKYVWRLQWIFALKLNCKFSFWTKTTHWNFCFINISFVYGVYIRNVRKSIQILTSKRNIMRNEKYSICSVSQTMLSPNDRQNDDDSLFLYWPHFIYFVSLFTNPLWFHRWSFGWLFFFFHTYRIIEKVFFEFVLDDNLMTFDWQTQQTFKSTIIYWIAHLIEIFCDFYSTRNNFCALQMNFLNVWILNV